jgi:hypothetical protein
MQRRFRVVAVLLALMAGERLGPRRELHGGLAARTSAAPSTRSAPPSSPPFPLALLLQCPPVPYPVMQGAARLVGMRLLTRDTRSERRPGALLAFAPACRRRQMQPGMERTSCRAAASHPDCLHFVLGWLQCAAGVPWAFGVRARAVSMSNPVHLLQRNMCATHQ